MYIRAVASAVSPVITGGLMQPHWHDKRGMSICMHCACDRSGLARMPPASDLDVAYMTQAQNRHADKQAACSRMALGN